MTVQLLSGEKGQENSMNSPSAGTGGKRETQAKTPLGRKTPQSVPGLKQRSITSFFSQSQGSSQVSQAVNGALDNLPSTPAPAGLHEEMGSSPIPLNTTESGRRVKRRQSYAESGSEDDGSAAGGTMDGPQRKRRASTGRARRSAADSDQDDAYKPQKSSSDDVSDEEFEGIGELTLDNDLEALLDSAASSQLASSQLAPTPQASTQTPTKTPTKQRLQEFSAGATPRTWATLGTGSSVASTPATRRSFAVPTSSPMAATPSSRTGSFKERNETRYRWLVDVRDSSGRRRDDPEYDLRTLLVPDAAWRSFSAFESQYWEIKSKHWDTVVFFKKGKFYELYENDADIGHQLFDLKMTDRVNMRMVGVPEATFDMWAGKFVAKGHKVARVDQLESAVGKTLRERTDAKAKAEKVLRRELSYVLTRGTLVDGALLSSEHARYCLALVEMSPCAFGVAFVDTSTASFSLCEVAAEAENDALQQLETLLVQTRPIEVCLERGNLGPAASKLLRASLPQAALNVFAPLREFWTAEQCRRELETREYFTGARPEALSQLWTDDAAMHALGGLLWYLTTLKLDRELVSLGVFCHYDPHQHATALVLDGQALVNLEVFQNSVDGGTEGTLFAMLDHCVTAAGKRLLREWVCHPLRQVEAIEARLDAVDDLTERDPALHVSMRRELAQIPDLPRILSRIHAGAAPVRDFMAALYGFKAAVRLGSAVAASASLLKSPRLQAAAAADGPLAPSTVESKLAFFDEAFDHDVARREGTIVPTTGYDAPFDEASGKLDAIKQQLQDLLSRTKQQLRCSRVQFRDMGKELFQLEVPNNAGFRPPDKSWVQTSATKDVTRYYTPELRALVQSHAEAEEVRADALRTVKQRLYARMDEDGPFWRCVSDALAQLDCLSSLAAARAQMGHPAARPELVRGSSDEPAIVDMEEMRHPCACGGVTWIPNSVVLSGDPSRAPSMMLLTGPNMGGKSTLLRQTCLGVILAQVGSYVPAQRMRLTPCDRIFTRIGASDNILAGQSTFMVELSETARILREATPRSLVILDELGRGTSTFDGYAIAFAVLHHLTVSSRALGMFSTHYHMLTDEYRDNALVALCYMDFATQGAREPVVFFYKLRRGVAPKSYGMNVARLAGVDEAIVERAQAVAARFEAQSRLSLHSIESGDIPMARQAVFARLVQHGAASDGGGRRLLAMRASLSGL